MQGKNFHNIWILTEIANSYTSPQVVGDNFWFVIEVFERLKTNLSSQESTASFNL